jgi:hypothetical protein
MTARCIVHRIGRPELDVTEHIKAIQTLVGADPDGVPYTDTVAAVRAAVGGQSTVPAPPRAEESQPPTLRDGSSGQHRAVRSLGLMALDYCLEEAARWGTAQVSDARIREYLYGSRRDNAPGHGPWMAKSYDPADPDKRWAFCIAAQGFAEDRGGGGVHKDAMPPWRSGVFEAERDAQDNKRPGERWVPVGEVWDAAANKLLWLPPPGSLVIYGNRTAAGRGHAERLIEATAAGIRSVGANENSRRWVVDAAPIPWTNLERADGTQRLYLRGFICPS